MSNNEIVPALTTPTGVDRQKGPKTNLTRALWRLTQAATSRPGEALSSTQVVFDSRQLAVQAAYRIRAGRNSTVINAMHQKGAAGTLEAWAEDQHYGHTIGVRYLSHPVGKRVPTTTEGPPLEATVAAREAANA